MIRGDEIPNDRFYDTLHIDEVLSDINSSFTKYFTEFGSDKLHLIHNFKVGQEKFESDFKKYIELMDRSYLEECEYDPSVFRNILRKDCPIIRRCLNSPEKVMDAYRKSFNRADSKDMLRVVINLSEYLTKFVETFNPGKQLDATNPSDLDVSILDTDEFTCGGVIGGGIRSHFLYNVRPDAFPNRSQFAIWALYFLTNRKSYGYEDDSEFLMIWRDGRGTQQNYFYQYDLFTYYAIQLFLLLESSSKQLGYILDHQFRFVYVDTFLNFVSDKHRVDIDILRPQNEEFHY